MEDFFRVHHEFVNYAGGKLYDLVHLSWLLGIVIIIKLVSDFYVRLDQNKRDRFKKQFAIALLLIELSRHLLIAVKGYYSVVELPLHLCSMMIFLSAIQAFFKNKYLNETLFLLSLPGAIAALIFPDWVSHPQFIFTSVHSYLTHTLLVMYTWMQIRSREIQPNIKNMPVVALGLAIIVPPMFFLNKAWHTNFYFLNVPSPGSPLVLFEQIFGNPGYIFGIILLLFAIWLSEYLMYNVTVNRKLKNRGIKQA